MEKIKKTVVSGIQPTGYLHLGNYLGAIKQWRELQDNPDYECKFGIMDLHALTTKDNHQNIMDMHHILVHFGIKFDNIFVQSGKREILKMYWHLACNTSIGQLNRMTQFKEKSEKNNQNLGLFSYPVLMAADILALEADLVPVGEDQKQHLELARDLAKKLGLKIPEPLISKTCGRIMSLTDSTKKMSKSDPNDNSRINLSDDTETIRKKIKKSNSGHTLGIKNLITIYQGCGGKEELDFSQAAKSKEIVADQIIKELNKF